MGFVEQVRGVATMVTAVLAAAAGLLALYHYVGVVASVGVMSAATMMFGLLAVQRLIAEARAVGRAISVANYHLAPNGHEHLLPEDLQGKSLREIVGAIAVEQRIHARRLSAGDQRMDAIEIRINERHNESMARMVAVEERLHSLDTYGRRGDT